MICGGSEAAVTPLSVAGFCAMRALLTRNDNPETASRPWDRDRDGFVLGEGAGVLILEEREHALSRGAKVLAEIVGYAANSDAFHTNAPPEDGRGVRRVMERPLEDAGLAPSAVQYLNAHATSTQLGDRAEAKAICEVFGEHTEHLLVSSTKSMIGHLLGAAGSLEAGLTILALRDQVAPPTTKRASSTCMALTGEPPWDVRTACGCLLRPSSHFCFEVVVQMCSDGAQRFLIPFQAVYHDCALERRNDQRRQLLGIGPRADFARPDSSADDRNNVVAPAT